MSETLKLRVIHPHYLGGTQYFPGDDLELSKEAFAQANSEHPFPYYHVLEGDASDAVAHKLAQVEPLPLEETIPLALEAMNISGETLKAVESPELPLIEEGELPEEESTAPVEEKSEKKPKASK